MIVSKARFRHHSGIVKIEKRYKRMHIFISEPEAALCKRAASIAGVTLSEWIRNNVLSVSVQLVEHQDAYSHVQDRELGNGANRVVSGVPEGTPDAGSPVQEPVPDGG